MKCYRCGRGMEVEADEYVCPGCGHRVLSVPDAMVEAASIPNLAGLFKKAKASGVLSTEVWNYGEGAPAPTP